MSIKIERTSYLIYGFRLGEQSDVDVIDDHHEELMENKPYSKIFNNVKSNQAIIEDLYGYYVGIKLADVNEGDWCEISEDDLLNLKNNKLLEYMNTWPDYLIDILKDKEPKLYMFSNAY